MDKPIIAESPAPQFSVLGLTLAPESYLVAVLRPDQIDLIADAVIARLDKQAARIAELESARESLVCALEAALGYMMNAKIDLETGTAKGTTIATLTGGISTTRATLALVTPGAFIVAD